MIDVLQSVGNKLVDEATSLVKKTFDSLADSNKISESESSSIFERIKRALFDKSVDMENTIQDFVKKFYEKMDFATPEEVEALRRRIKILEKLTSK